jgi:hypothetical protein
VGRILYQGFRFSSKRTQYLLEKTCQGIARGTTVSEECLVSEFTYRCEGFAVIWSQFIFEIRRKSSFVFGKEFLYFPLNQAVGYLGKGS